MQPRTLYALIAAGLLLPMGTVFAQETSPPAAEAAPEPAYSEEPEPATSQPIESDHPEPAGSRPIEGERAPRARPQPIEGERPEPVGPEMIVITDPVWPEPAPIRPHPQRHACERVHALPSSTSLEPVPPTPIVADDDLTPAERRLAAMIDRIEKRLWRLEQAALSPRPCVPEPVRETASLAVGDRNLPVGEDGARVAILLDGGDHGGRFRLAVRSHDDGWRYALERDGVALGPHQRTFVWLRVAPGEAPTSTYEVVASDGSTSLVARGHATSAAPQIV